MQIRFHLVSEEELDSQRKRFHTGQLDIRMENQTFNMK